MIEKISDLQAIDPFVDHVRGPEDAPLLVEYGDYECPYSRRAFREIERAERRLEGGLRFVFRHFPLTDIHPHALAAAAAAEAAALRDAMDHALLRFDSCYVIAPSHNPVGPFDFGGAYDGGGAAFADRRRRGATFLQPPNVSVADEPRGMRPSDDDGVDA